MRSAEFQLLVTACHAAFEDRALEQLPTSVDWDRVLALADRHRVQALCWQALASFNDEMPIHVSAALRTQAREIVVDNLRAAAECGRLVETFKAAPVPLLFLKGLSLAALAYPNPHLKMSADIDLLVEPDRLADAADVLRSGGYFPVEPDTANNRQLGRWHATSKESIWRNGQIQIDLHTRVADHPAMLAGLSASSPSQEVTIASGITIPTLADDELFAYLCMHGASSAWFRLKWVTDLAAWLKHKDPPQIRRLYLRSQELGSGRAAGQALLLAESLFPIDLGVELRNHLVADPTTRWLVRVAERQLLNPAAPTERFLGTTTIHLSQLGLRPSWRFGLSEAARQFRGKIGRLR